MGRPTKSKITIISSLILVGLLLALISPVQAQQSFDPQVAADTYVNSLTEEQRASSDAYFEGGYWLQLWGLLYTLAVAWLLLNFRISARMRNWAERVIRYKPLQTAIYAGQYIVLTAVLFLPLTVYQGYFREHKYGLATQTFAPWFSEQMIGLGVNLVLMSLLLVALYAVIRRAPRSWWLWGTGVSVLFMFFALTIAPVFINPLFNDYQPLEQGEIRQSILSQARANGVPADNVYQFDASRQTTRISANVSGFMGTTRISLNDNLLNRTTPEEIEAVMGHELGHYVLNHGTKLFIQFGLVLALGFAWLRWSFDYCQRRKGDQWEVRGIGDTAGLPLVMALISIYFFFATPVTNSIIRSAESEADIYALNAVRQPDGFARVAMRLSEYRKIDPGYWEEIIFYDHPSGRTRVEMAMRWKAENLDSSD